MRLKVVCVPTLVRDKAGNVVYGLLQDEVILELEDDVFGQPQISCSESYHLRRTGPSTLAGGTPNALPTEVSSLHSNPVLYRGSRISPATHGNNIDC
jgi:hypothetical protein